MAEILKRWNGSEWIPIANVYRFGSDISYFGKEGTGDGEFGFPNDVDVDSSGNIYVLDMHKNCIQKFSPSGVFIKKIGSYGSMDGQFIFTDPATPGAYGGGFRIHQDKLVVADMYNHRIQILDLDGNMISKFGSYGSGNNNFYYVSGVDIGPDGFVYVADRGNARLKKHSQDGTYIGAWASPAGSMWKLMASYDGYVYTTHRGEKVYKWTANGVVVGNITPPDRSYFRSPNICKDIEEKIMVSDIADNNEALKYDRILLYDSNGTYLKSIYGIDRDAKSITRPRCVCRRGNDLIVIGREGKIYYNYFN